MAENGRDRSFAQECEHQIEEKVSNHPCLAGHFSRVTFDFNIKQFEPRAERVTERHAEDKELRQICRRETGDREGRWDGCMWMFRCPLG